MCVSAASRPRASRAAPVQRIPPQPPAVIFITGLEHLGDEGAFTGRASLRGSELRDELPISRDSELRGEGAYGTSPLVRDSELRDEL